MNEEVKQIMEYAGGYDIVPIKKEILADVITPISLLRKIAAGHRRFYLLESVEGGEKWGRYSFLGYDPVMRVSCTEEQVVVETGGSREVIRTKDAFDVVRGILRKHRSPKIDGMPPFTGGFVGYFSYAMIAHAEPVLHLRRSGFHDFDLMLFDKVIVYDQLRQKIIVVANVSTKGNVEENYEKAMDEICGIVHLIHEKMELKQEEAYDKVDFTCNVTEEEYGRIVERTKEYIRNGDIFQAVISRQLS